MCLLNMYFDHICDKIITVHACFLQLLKKDAERHASQHFFHTHDDEPKIKNLHGGYFDGVSTVSTRVLLVVTSS